MRFINFRYIFSTSSFEPLQRVPIVVARILFKLLPSETISSTKSSTVLFILFFHRHSMMSAFGMILPSDTKTTCSATFSCPLYKLYSFLFRLMRYIFFWKELNKSIHFNLLSINYCVALYILSYIGLFLLHLFSNFVKFLLET